jgi:hypothetical protein
MNTYYKDKDIQACEYQNYDKYFNNYCSVDPYGYCYPEDFFPCGNKGTQFQYASSSCCAIKINNAEKFKNDYNNNMYSCIRNNYNNM